MFVSEVARLTKEIEALLADRATLKHAQQSSIKGSIFCSELVAALYQGLGLLPDFPPGMSRRSRACLITAFHYPFVDKIRCRQLLIIGKSCLPVIVF